MIKYGYFLDNSADVAHYIWKFLQIRCHKGAATKMLKRLVGMPEYNYTCNIIHKD